MATRKRVDGGAIDPRLARILLRYRERVAQAAADAFEEMRIEGWDANRALLEQARVGIGR